MVKCVAGSEKAEFEKRGMKLRYTSGVGKTVFFADTFGMGTTLGVFPGDYDYVQVSALNAGDPGKRDVGLKKIAGPVLDRWK